MSRAERKTKVDRCRALPISRQCEVLFLSRSSAYRAPAGLSVEELDLMRKLDESCICATRSRALGDSVMTFGMCIAYRSIVSVCSG